MTSVPNFPREISSDIECKANVDSNTPVNMLSKQPLSEGHDGPQHKASNEDPIPRLLMLHPLPACGCSGLVQEPMRVIAVWLKEVLDQFVVLPGYAVKTIKKLPNWFDNSVHVKEDCPPGYCGVELGPPVQCRDGWDVIELLHQEVLEALS